MANENANQDIEFDDFDLECEQISNQLEEQLKEHVEGLEFLKEEIEQIGNPDNLGNVIQEVVWEQFINQIGVIAGEDFIKENRNLHLDLRDKAHIQTTENFDNGKIATHNAEINYQERYDDWQSNFIKDESGNVVTHKTRTGKEEATLTKDARKPFDKDRPSGSAEKHTDMDHIIPTAEIIRDAAANAHMTKEEQLEFANSNVNTHEMDSRQNRSKGDMPMEEWLDNSNANGQKPNEIFNISAEEDREYREKDGISREEYEKRKNDGEQKSIKSGKKSQKEEAFRISGKALRAVVMSLLADLVKEIIAKLIKWFKSVQKNLKSLLESLKEAIDSFFRKMKTHLFNSGNTIFSTVITAIFGPVSRMLTSIWTLLKQGWKSLKEAVEYIRKPENKDKPIGRLMLETGKIVIAGLTTVSAIALGQVIEKGLMAIPPFASPIPLIGSLASILGIFFGAVVTGIIGAIAINMIEKKIEKSRKRENIEGQVIAGNNILQLQYQMGIVSEEKLKHDKFRVVESIKERHSVATNMTRESLGNIAANCKKDESIANDIDRLLKELDDEKL